MIRSRKMDICCIAAIIAAVILTAAITAGCLLWAEPEKKTKRAFPPSDDYVGLIFDDSRVHEIDIRLPQVNWDYMVRHAMEEQYVICTAVIDGEEIKNVAIRPKGNSSLSAIKTQGSNHFSFKIEFDHYNSETCYHGLDKLSLNNLGQDVSCMKDYLSYHMMNEAGVPAPLSSYAMVKLNGEDFGLYLAVEAIEDSFAYRCYGEDAGNLYKPECFAVETVTPMAFIDDNSELLNEDFTTLGKGDRVDIMGRAVKKPFEKCFGENMDAAAFKYLGDDPKKYNVFFDSSVFDITDADKASFIDAVRRLNSDEPDSAINADDLINYFLVHNFVNNYDGYTGVFVHNYYVYEKDGRLSMVPWDYNLAFGIFTFETVVKCILGADSPYDVKLDVGDAMDDVTNMVNYPIDTPTITASLDERPLLSAILNDEYYLGLYHDRYRLFLENYFHSGRFEEEYQRVHALISPYADSGQIPYAKENFERASRAVHDYCVLRAQSIQGQLDGTIPATMEGQREHYENLIDASDVELFTSVTFDSLLFGIRDTDIREILDAVAGSHPHNTDGIEQTIEEVSEDQGRLPEVIWRVMTSSSLVKKALASLLLPPALFIISVVVLCVAKKKVSRYERRKKGGGGNAVSS